MPRRHGALCWHWQPRARRLNAVSLAAGRDFSLPTYSPTEHRADGKATYLLFGVSCLSVCLSNLVPEQSYVARKGAL